MTSIIPLNSLLSEITKPIQTLARTRLLHAFIIKSCLSYNPFYVTKIVGFYSQNNNLISARHLFDTAPQRTVYLWNSIIRAYARAHKFRDAFLLFKHLLSSDTEPDSHTFACIARACAESSDVNTLRLMHGKVVVFGLGLDPICGSAFVSCYSKLGRVDEAGFVFRGIEEPDLVLCNAMISGYGSWGSFWNAVALFNVIRNRGILPDAHTLVGLIVGLTDDTFLGLGETIHGYCVKYGLILNDHISSALVSMYSRCKSMDLALSVFDNLLQPDLVSWSAVIAGFSQAGDHVKALMLCREMLMKGGRADAVLLAVILSASAKMAFLGPGCEIHCYALRHEYNFEVAVSSALIDMYAKCGFVEIAIKAFMHMPKRNIVSCNIMISSLGLYGRAPEAFQLFDEMLEEGFKPDETTFTGLLCACCHSGLVNEGREYFRMMTKVFGIQPQTEHHVHMVKLLGMSGKLQEAYDLIKSLPEPVNSGVWGALLSCCDSHKKYDLVEEITEHLYEKEAKNCSYQVMLSNSFAGNGRWDNVKQLRIDRGGAKGKIPGTCWINDSNHYNRMQQAARTRGSFLRFISVLFC